MKSGKACGGYQRDLTFIHHKFPEKESHSSSSEPELLSVEDDDAGVSSIASWNDFDFSSESSFTLVRRPGTSPYQDWSTEQSQEWNSEETESSPTFLQQWSSQSPPPSPPSPPPLQLLSSSLTLTALTVLHTSVFNSFFLPRRSFTIEGSISPFGHPANWVLMVPPLLSNDLSLQLAYLALSSSRIGRANHDDNLLASSKKFYGKALRETQRAIADPKRRHTEETLLACSTLSLFEIFETQRPPKGASQSGPHGWLSHAAGVARLLEARGPESYTTEKGHAVFLHSRIFTIIHATTSRKACFLSQPEWMTVPWKNHAKSMTHQFIDVMAFLPVLLETYDNTERNKSVGSEEQRRARQSLLAQCAILNSQLHRWYAQLCGHYKGRTLWHTLPSDEDDTSYPFPHFFSFNDHFLAYIIMLYWTTALVIQATMCQIAHLLNQDLDPGNGLLYSETILPPSIDPLFYAMNIVQSLPYFLHPEMGTLGPNLALFPMGMTFAFFASPTQPSFVSDKRGMKSMGSMMNKLIEGEAEGPRVGVSSIRDIMRWFGRLFTDLNQRNMPGGTFLSSLMTAVADGPGPEVFKAASEP